MKYRSFFLLAALLALFAPGARAQSRIVDATMPSRLLGVEKSYTLYLPDGYDASGENYPVLYLLHGAFGDNTNWSRLGRVQAVADSLIALGQLRPLIVVMPDARGVLDNGAGDRMGYFDVEGWPYERFFFEEFIPRIDSLYRTLPVKEGRAIAGLSMGGGGAVVYAQHHPELFAAVYSISGLLDNFPGRSVSPSYSVPFLWSVVRTSPVDRLALASPEQVERYRTVRWFVDCGDDDFLWRPNIDFYTAMKERGIPVEFRMRDGGHSWNYWRSALPEALKWSFGRP